MSTSRLLVRWTLCAAALATGTFTPPARADDGAATQLDARSRQAAALYKQGNDLYDQKKYPEAEAAYLNAWALKKSYDIAVNLGAVALDMNKPREAAEFLTYAEREFPAGGKPAALLLVQERRKQALGRVGALRIRVAQPNAAVYVNGRLVGRSPLADDVYADPGPTVIECKLAGYEDKRLSPSVVAGGASELAVDLEPAGRSLVPGLLLGGAGVVALGVGGAFLGVAGGKKGDAQALSTQSKHGCPAGAVSPVGVCKDLASATSSADLFGNLGVGALVVGGVAIAGAVTYLLWPASRPEQAPPSAVRALPFVGTSGGGMLVSGSF